MPLNVRRLSSSIFLVLFISATLSLAQTQQAVSQPSPIPVDPAPVKAPTAGEIMRERISKAKAFIAVRNYNAAIYELEMIRRETSDQSVHAVTNILLMNSYLEQGNYKKAQTFLGEFYKQFKSGNANASTQYSAVAGQVVKGARNQMDRYRSLGLSVSDRNLPLEAVNDIEKMREMLEVLITQAKETSRDKACTDVAIPLLEEATAARSGLGRDDYDAKRWRDASADAREEMAGTQSVVINATDGASIAGGVPQNTTPVNTVPVNANSNLAANAAQPVIPPVSQPISQPQTAINKPSDTTIAANNTPVDLPVTKPAEQSSGSDRQRLVANDPPKQIEPVADPPAPQANASSGPVEVGSLLVYVTKQAPATYPPAARSMRASGVVKVEVIVDENGDVTEIKRADGPTLLQAAAKDAIRKWKFRPFTRDGQAVRASGFVNFNFTL